MDNLITIQIVVTIFVLFLSFVEAIVLSRHKPGDFKIYEALISVGDLAGRKLIALLPLNIATPFYSFAWDNRLFHFELNAAWLFFILFIGMEFLYYCYHRASHRVHFFWATHAVHHSPNQLTLSTAFRLGWTGKITGTTLFFIPLVWVGFPPEVILTALSLNLLYQFWLHTVWIPRLGWLEYIFNTPSSHRVHHASNTGYLDANFGGVLIIFDRLFGTYRKELPEEPCVYGLVHPITSKNLLTVEFSQWKILLKKIKKAKGMINKIRILLKPPG